VNEAFFADRNPRRAGRPAKTSAAGHVLRVVNAESDFLSA